MKEVIKVIKDNITFNKLPKDIQNNMIDAQANDILISFDEGVYTKKTAKADAKLYYEDWEKDKKYVLYHSNFYGIQADEQERFYENTN
jgi:hypothetical protein